MLRLSALKTSRNVWFDSIRLAVRNGRRVPSIRCNRSHAMKTVRGDPPDLGADCKGNLDLLVDRRLVAASAESAMVVFMAQGFQRVMRIQNAAAAGTEHVPGEVEQTHPCGMQETGNDSLFIETGALGKFQRVDSIELVIFTIPDQVDDRLRDGRVGGLLQNRKLRLDVSHG